MKDLNLGILGPMQQAPKLKNGTEFAWVTLSVNRYDYSEVSGSLIPIGGFEARVKDFKKAYSVILTCIDNILNAIHYDTALKTEIEFIKPELCDPYDWHIYASLINTENNHLLFEAKAYL